MGTNGGDNGVGRSGGGEPTADLRVHGEINGSILSCFSGKPCGW